MVLILALGKNVIQFLSQMIRAREHLNGEKMAEVGIIKITIVAYLNNIGLSFGLKYV